MKEKQSNRVQFIYLFPAIAGVFLYDYFTNWFFMKAPSFLPSLMGVTRKTVEIDSSLMDTVSITILLLVFWCWWKIIQIRNKPVICQEKYWPLKSFLLGFGFLGISGFWMLLAAGLAKVFKIVEVSMNNFSDTWTMVDQDPYLWLFLSVVVVGPIVEEVLFRGIVFHYLEKVSEGLFPILASALAFGIWHGELVQSVYVTILGIGLAIVYQKTRSLKMPIAIHMINNFLVTLPPGIDHPYVEAGINVVSLLLGIPALLLLMRMAKGKTRTIPESSSV